MVSSTARASAKPSLPTTSASESPGPMSLPALDQAGPLSSLPAAEASLIRRSG